MPLSVNAVLDESESMLRRLLGEEIQLVRAAAPAVALTMADPGQMNQVLLNLVVNARDAMPHGGTLTITTGDVVLTSEPAGTVGDIQPGSYVELCVRDTGSGIDPDALPHIFEPFFSTKGTAGTGLGLATVYGIVRQNQGGISVVSEPG